MEDFVLPAFVCPITHQVMVRPVCTVYGHTYEEDALLAWLKTKSSDPLTGNPLTADSVVPNRGLRDALRAHLESLVPEQLPDDARKEVCSHLEALRVDEEKCSWKSGRVVVSDLPRWLPTQSSSFLTAERFAVASHICFAVGIGGGGGLLFADTCLICPGLLKRALEAHTLVMRKGFGALLPVKADLLAYLLAWGAVGVPLISGSLFAVAGATASLTSFVSVAIKPPYEARRLGLTVARKFFVFSFRCAFFGAVAQTGCNLFNTPARR
eukprot:TRINITY_DN9298_c0_g1_i2.p1 TRINITY_DN9298_c0_g1~~TRINITY_DN9298_c0_g1_i2.p1  ORF type:complete len:268 (-),score=28.59 TRINITY_DN9298_c0_g1_i2:132-935(-)